jgi:hypothetical protein
MVSSNPFLAIGVEAGAVTKDVRLTVDCEQRTPLRAVGFVHGAWVAIDVFAGMTNAVVVRKGSLENPALFKFGMFVER